MMKSTADMTWKVARNCSDTIYNMYGGNAYSNVRGKTTNEMWFVIDNQIVNLLIEWIHDEMLKEHNEQKNV